MVILYISKEAERERWMLKCIVIMDFTEKSEKERERMKKKE